MILHIVLQYCSTGNSADCLVHKQNQKAHNVAIFSNSKKRRFGKTAAAKQPVGGKGRGKGYRSARNKASLLIAPSSIIKINTKYCEFSIII